MAANFFNVATLNSSSSSPHESDDISLFLEQIILRSSSSSITRQQSFATYSNHIVVENQGFAMGPGSSQISVPDPSPGLNTSSGCSFTATDLSSSSLGKLDNETDEYDYESEEVVEAAVEETALKPPVPRCSGKRSRAAEVHNQSEKRRRSRINEKMKALQNLIPNSNKTDKASMLDEAIEYLKQLQLQVQMLTMKNGLSLYPIYAPGMMQPNQMRTDIYDTVQNVSADALLCVQDKRVKQAPITGFSSVNIGSKTSFEVEDSSVQDHFGTFQRSRSSEGICEEKVRLSDDCPQTSSTRGVKASLIPCETNISNLKENTFDACLAGGDHMLQNFVNHPIFSSQLDM